MEEHIMKSVALSAGFAALVITVSQASAQAADTCVGQWASNGVWRLRIEKFETAVRADGAPGYALTIHVRNDSNVTSSMVYAGAGSDTLWLNNETTLDMGTSESVAWNALLQKDLRPGTGFTHKIEYYSFDTSVPLGKAVKWTLDIDPKKAGGEAPHYSTKTPGFEIRLDCPH
jgi:hypothetical protein